MPRPLTFGNRLLHIGIDARYWIRDLHASRQGGHLENHLNGHFIRLGFGSAHGFSWTDDPAWSIEMRREGAVGITRLRHERLGIDVTARDALVGAVYVRRFEFAAGGDVRLFTSHDLRLCESDVGDTALYHPGIDALVHYKGSVWVGISARSAGGGLDAYATGIKGFDGLEGTWRDAEDGELEAVPVSQGSVDSTLAVHLDPAAGNWVEWALALAGSVGELEGLLADGPPALPSAADGASTLPSLSRGGVVERGWLQGEGAAKPIDRKSPSPLPLSPDRSGLGSPQAGRGVPGKASGRLPDRWRALFDASLDQIEAHTHGAGAILAALDSDILTTNRATYAYVWPRDGALVAHALDRVGRHGQARGFFEFVAAIIERDGPRLYQKYHTDGSFGASWHPWTGEPSGRPHQGDQLPLVLHALASHPQPVVAPETVRAAAEFLVADRDPATGLPLPSYDLWEERRGAHAFTVAAVIAGLRGASRLLADPAFAEVADQMVADFETHLVNPETGALLRGLQADGTPDTLPDASLLMVPLLGALPFDHPAVLATLPWLEESLWVQSEIGGLARYPGDYYFRRSDAFPGNPWVITSLWLARCLCRVPGGRARAETLIDWAQTRAHPTGALPEQVHPETGEVLGVSPLTWSHAEFLLAVLDAVENGSVEC